jgi:hypothetical protein
MDRWDVVIILGAGYVAIMSLVRLMARRRNQSVEQIRGQITQQMGKKGQSKKKKTVETNSTQEDRGAA